MPGGTIRYVPLQPPKDGATRTSSAAEWTIDFEELENTINSKTKMIVSLLSISGNKFPHVNSSMLGLELSVSPGAYYYANTSMLTIV